MRSKKYQRCFYCGNSIKKGEWFYLSDDRVACAGCKSKNSACPIPTTAINWKCESFREY